MYERANLMRSALPRPPDLRSVLHAVWTHSADAILFLAIAIPLLVVSLLLGAGHAFTWQP